MERVTKRCCIFFCILWNAAASLYAQLYTQYTSPIQLSNFVQSQFAGNGVEIYNVKFTGMFLGGADSTQPILDIGFFRKMNTTLAIDSGIILTSGMLHEPYGLGIPAWFGSNDGKNSAGDSLIDTYIAPLTSIDAAILEFDFVPNGDTIKFNYVFASDEYPGQNCGSDIDVFFFHISGPGIVGEQNIALVPGTSEYVGVGTINNGVASGGINCINLGNSQYYESHTSDTNFIFNGATTVLTAIAPTIPCQTYHLRFAIADVTSTSEDGAVFLQANSFNSEPISITPYVSYSGPDTLLYEDCGQATLVIRRTYNLQQPKTYTINYSGTSTYGTDYLPAPLTLTMQPGQMYDTLYIYPTADFISDNGETLIISVGDTLCNGDYFISEIAMLINEKQGLAVDVLPNDGGFCDTVMFTSIVTGYIPPIEYSWNNGTSTDTTFTLFALGQQTVVLEVTDGCSQIAYDTSTVTFDVSPVADFIFTPDYPDLLNSEVTFIDQSSQNTIAWLWSLGENNTSTLQNPVIYYHNPDTYMVSLIVFNDLQCSDTIIGPVVVHELPVIFIPNSFTPNGDNINDLYFVHGKEISYIDIRICDRWGNELYSSNSLSNGWNGTFGNKLCPSGVYALKVDYSYTNAPEKVYTRLERINLIR